MNPATRIVGLLALILAGPAFRCGAAEGKLAAAAFSCDVTPPVGHPLCGGWIQPLEAVDDPLLAKGLVVADGRTRYVICALDWCLVQTEACDAFREKLAAALEIPASQVSLHTVHQHNAPIADVYAQRLLDALPSAPAHLDLEFMRQVTDRVAASARAARGKLRPLTHIGFASNRVDRFASNRRVRLADGAIHPRFSSTKDQTLQAAPEGLIDPWLRTVTFFSGDQPLARLHYYATHPQSFYGDGRATSDTAGLARERLEREEGVPQIYLTGCGGNITAGKYNDGSPVARAGLTDRLYAAMKSSLANTERAPIRSAKWKTAKVRLAMRMEPEWRDDQSRITMADTSASAVARLSAALNLAWSERVRTRPEVELTRLDLGPVSLLGLPAEAFLEYQLYAQSLRPGGFVAVAAYGEGGPGYICTDGAIAEGGYEPTDARVGPPSEFRLKAAIAELLAGRGGWPGTPPYPDKWHLLAYRDARGLEHPVTNPRQWAKRRAHILQHMRSVMGPLPGATRKTPPRIRVEQEVDSERFTRRKITFAVETGDRLSAYLFLPKGVARKTPAMLCLHQTTPEGKAEPAGLSGRENLHYAKELAERGYVALAPDYPNFGDYRIDVYARGYASATLKGVWNHLRCVDLLRSLPQVDRRRIGVIGHSLGGHNALFLAAFDPRVKVVVTSCGFNSFYQYCSGDLTGWSHAGYMPRIATQYGRDPKRMPFDFTEVLAAVAPRPVFINAPLGDDNFPVAGVKDCVIAAAPVYNLLGARDNLTAQHPACGHDFPAEVRQSAYRWLDRHLGRGSLE
jgi:dienelactone hydrolase